MNISQSTITIMVKDMDVSIPFYQAIGLTLKNRWGNHYAEMIAPGLTIGIHPANRHFNGSGNTSIGFIVGDFEDAKSFLARLSIPVSESEDEGGQILNFEDPDGTLLYIYKPKW
jgi:catechol 2,3-dioxygenase-like lactoylglutathione lyase family enzyme